MEPTAESLLQFPGVVCPVCHSALHAVDAQTILCRSCARAYPVRDGLAVLIRGEAREGSMQQGGTGS